MTCACTIWELAADAYLLNLQRLQNRVLHGTEKPEKCTLVRELQEDLKIPYTYE
jgi:hypothetical protein